MSDVVKRMEEKIRRSLTSEFIRQEDDFDFTRKHREHLVNKVMENVGQLKLVSEEGGVNDDTETGLKVITTAAKLLADVERANVSAITLKLRNQEQEVASAAAAKDRIAMVLLATKPGTIAAPNVEAMEDKLSELYEHDIQDFELKMNPRDLSE